MMACRGEAEAGAAARSVTGAAATPALGWRIASSYSVTGGKAIETQPFHLG
jgi:hypothetical protein